MRDFEEINEALFEDSARAHAYANTLGPIIGNIGNILYVIMALVGGVFLLSRIPNVGLSTLLHRGGGFAQRNERAGHHKVNDVERECQQQAAQHNISV